tara:strand:- start:2184 stop:2663 length:480 start_codon:yes stop_codon:yes gene_type:complete
MISTDDTAGVECKSQEMELTNIELKSIPKHEFDEYTKGKIHELKQKITLLNNLSVKYSRYHYLLTLPQLLVNAAMTSSVLVSHDSEADYKTILTSLGIFNAVLQSLSTSLKYGQKSQKMLDKKKSYAKLKTELELGMLMTSITNEYKQDILTKITKYGI